MGIGYRKPKSVAPVKVTLDKTEVSLAVGGTETLQATTTPEGTTVTFESSDETIAKVTAKQGKVTAIAAGIATITAKTESGETATCKVTVTA